MVAAKHVRALLFWRKQDEIDYAFGHAGRQFGNISCLVPVHVLPYSRIKLLIA
jgi:hypothetical protein